MGRVRLSRAKGREWPNSQQVFFVSFPPRGRKEGIPALELRGFSPERDARKREYAPVNCSVPVLEAEMLRRAHVGLVYFAPLAFQTD